MCMYPTHAVAGAALWLAGCAGATLLGLPVEPLAALVGTPIAVLASGAPDLDHPSSRPARCLGPITRLIAFWLAAQSAAIYSRTKTTKDRPNESGHRGITHTALFCLVLGAIPAAVLALAGHPELAWLGLPVGVGALSHVLTDGLTFYGTPMLWPIKIRGRRWYSLGSPRVLRIGTNTKWEHRGVMPALVLLTAASSWLLFA